MIGASGLTRFNIGPVFHGTQAKFTEFRAPACFSPRFEFAMRFSGPWGETGEYRETSNVRVAWLQLENPFKTRDWRDTENLPYRTEGVAELRRRGHDGIAFDNGEEKELWVFEKEQIFTRDVLTVTPSESVGVGFQFNGIQQWQLGADLADLSTILAKGGVRAVLEERWGGIVLSWLEVPEERRNGGVGTAALGRIVALSDFYDVPIRVLARGEDSDSTARLEVFYARSGFVLKQDGLMVRAPAVPEVLRKATPVQRSNDNGRVGW